MSPGAWELKFLELIIVLQLTRDSLYDHSLIAFIQMHCVQGYNSALLAILQGKWSFG